MSTETAAKRSRTRPPNNKTTTGFRSSGELWAVREPLRPERVNTHRVGGGRPRVPERRCAEAIVDVRRTAGPWAALQETAFCAKSSAPDRFSPWVAAGVFLRLWQAGGEEGGDLPSRGWSGGRRGGVLTNAPLGGEKDAPTPYRPRHRRRKTPSADPGAGESDRRDDGRRQAPRHAAGAGDD